MDAEEEEDVHPIYGESSSDDGSSRSNWRRREAAAVCFPHRMSPSPDISSWLGGMDPLCSSPPPASTAMNSCCITHRLCQVASLCGCVLVMLNNPCLVSSICNAPPVLKPCCASIAFLASAFTASSSPRALRGHAWLPLAAQQSHRMRLHRAVLRSCRAPWLPSATPSCWTRPQQLVLRRHLWYHASSMRLKSGMWPTTTVCSGRSSCAAREYTYGAWRRRRGCSSTRRGATSRLLRY